MRDETARNDNRLFWLGLILCTLYQSYRYPLQINSSGTSPTYSDTPLLLQAGKFLLAFPLMVMATYQCLQRSAPLRQWLIGLGVLCLASYALFKTFGDSQGRYLESSFWMLFALVLAWSADALRISALDRFFRYLLIFALGSTLVEVALFVTVGRLPALAFAGSFSVRFGGFLDDPNGFAALLFLLLGWSYVRYKGAARLLVLGSIVFALLLTQSWTAIGFFVVVVLSWALVSGFRCLPLAVTAICASLGLAMFLVQHSAWTPGQFLEEILIAKQGSVAGHSISWTQLGTRWADWAVLGDSIYTHFESWWAIALIDFGALWLCVFVAITGFLVFSLAVALYRSSGDARPVYAGLFLFACYFVFGSFNLPLPAVFPVNIWFFLFSFLVAFGRVQDSQDKQTLAQRSFSSEAFSDSDGTALGSPGIQPFCIRL